MKDNKKIIINVCSTCVVVGDFNYDVTSFIKMLNFKLVYKRTHQNA